MKLSICLAGTANYLHAFKSCVRRVVTAARHRSDVHIVFVSDTTQQAVDAQKFIEQEIPKHWDAEHIQLNLTPSTAYKKQSNLLIAKLHSEMFSAARRAHAEQCWTVEPDILVRPDSLRMMEWALAMPREDGGPYYELAICTYPNGLFIGGHGSPAHHIAEDFTAEERTLTPEIKERWEMHKKEAEEFKSSRKAPDEEWHKKGNEIREEIKKCPPCGNIFEVIAKHGYRRRGWIDYAYPGIGEGCIVPTDWVGQGCNLLSKRALALSTLDGYEGFGTPDLFLTWHRYNPAGIRMACITHSPCDHVKLRSIAGAMTPIHLQAMHEQMGDCRGHLRVIERPWIEI